MLSSATSEPVISEPYIHTIPIDSSCSFLLLMSEGLCKSYQEATKSDQVNKEIAQMVVEQVCDIYYIMVCLVIKFNLVS